MYAVIKIGLKNVFFTIHVYIIYKGYSIFKGYRGGPENVGGGGGTRCF